MPTSVLRRAAAASLQTATVQPSRERPRAGSSFRGDVLDGELCKLGGSGLKKVPMPASLSQDLGQIFAQTKRCKTLRDAGRDVRAGIANTIRMIHTALAKADASEFLSEMKQVNPAQFEAFFLGMKARNIAETHAEIDKIQAKVQTIDQRIEEARRLNLLIKAGSGAGSDDDAGTPRSDTSTDSLDEAMRNHEPRRSRGNSTDSDDSDRSVAAGATTSSSHSETARLKILTSILRVLTPLRQELNGLQDTITLAKKRSARRHEALFKQMVAEAELFRQTTVEIADDTLEQMKVSDQSGLQKILIRVTDELQSTRDAIRRFKSALGIR